MLPYSSPNVAIFYAGISFLSATKLKFNSMGELMRKNLITVITLLLTVQCLFAKDSDKDGIKDKYDNCPKLAENVNGYKDQDGCPDQKPPAARPKLNNYSTIVSYDANKGKIHSSPHYKASDKDKIELERIKNNISIIAEAQNEKVIFKLFLKEPGRRESGWNFKFNAYLAKTGTKGLGPELYGIVREKWPKAPYEGGSITLKEFTKANTGTIGPTSLNGNYALWIKINAINYRDYSRYTNELGYIICYFNIHPGYPVLVNTSISKPVIEVGTPVTFTGKTNHLAKLKTPYSVEVDYGAGFKKMTLKDSTFSHKTWIKSVGKDQKYSIRVISAKGDISSKKEGTFTVNENKSVQLVNAIKSEYPIPTDIQDINWSAGKEVGAGYFDFHVDNSKLLWAIPFVPQNIAINKDSLHLALPFRRTPPEYTTLQWSQERGKSFKGDISLNSKVISNLNSITISGLSNWRLPTDEEIQNAPFIQNHLKQMGIIRTGLLYMGLESSQMNYAKTYPPKMTAKGRYSLREVIQTPMIKTKNGHFAFYAIPDNQSKVSAEPTTYPLYSLKTIGWKKWTWSYGSTVFLVKKMPPAITGILHTSLTPKEKVYKIAEYYYSKTMVAKKRAVPKLKTANIPPKPTVSPKGEFETTSQYNARVAKSLEGWLKDSLTVAETNNKHFNAHLRKQEMVEFEYQERLSRLSDPAYQKVIYEECLESAIRLVYGIPKFTDVKYDADRQQMSVTIKGSNDLVINSAFKVPLTNARQTKADILSGKIIPQVLISPDMQTAKVLKQSNESMIAAEFSVAMKKRTIKDLQSFVNAYPQSSQAIKAKEEITTINEEMRVAEQKRQQEAEVQRKLAEESDKREWERFSRPKKKGDWIQCRSWGGGLFSGKNRHWLEGYVEAVQGNRIKIRISKACYGTSRYASNKTSLIYNGTTCRQNTIIWDLATNWKHK